MAGGGWRQASAPQQKARPGSKFRVSRTFSATQSSTAARSVAANPCRDHQLGHRAGRSESSSRVAGSAGRSRKRLMSAASNASCAPRGRAGQRSHALLEARRRDRAHLRHIGTARERDQALDCDALNRARDFGLVAVLRRRLERRRDHLIDHPSNPGIVGSSACCSTRRAARASFNRKPSVMSAATMAGRDRVEHAARCSAGTAHGCGRSHPDAAGSCSGADAEARAPPE